MHIEQLSPHQMYCQQVALVSGSIMLSRLDVCDLKITGELQPLNRLLLLCLSSLWSR